MEKIVSFFIAIAICISITSCTKTPQEIIQKEVTAANNNCPLNIGNGLTLTKVELDGLYVVYQCQGSDEMFFSQDPRMSRDERSTY